MSPFISVEGTLYVMPAVRGEESGTYAWVDAGARHERVHAEMYLPLVDCDRLDSQMSVAPALMHTEDGDESAEVRVEFGRVRDGHGVVSLSGESVEADVRFELRAGPPDGRFCRQCGSELDVRPVQVITPPDGGLMGVPDLRCPRCDGS
jgi:hypothetical protein